MARFNSLSTRQKLWLAGASLVGLVLAAFWQVGRCDFLIYDDWDYVVTNDMVRRGLTGESIGWAFQKFHAANWHPLTWLSHMLDVELFGLRPMGHHATNLLLHAANTVLLLVLVNRLTGSLWRSAVVAALFGLHPTHVESVAWVAERKDVLSTFFGLLCLLAYGAYAKARGEGRGARGYYALALLAFALGLMSKPMLVTWPFVMLLLDFWPLKRMEFSTFSTQLLTLKKLVLEKLPFFALTLGSCILTFLAQRAGGAVQSMEQLSPLTRFGNSAVSYVRYLGKTVWPVDLSIFYPYPAAWPIWLIVGAFLLLGALVTVGVLNLRRRPYLLFGLCWFLGTLVPVIGLVQVGAQSMADRYQYIPQIGLFIAVVWLVGELVLARMNWRGPVIGGAVVALGACFVLTQVRVRDWQNSETLFTQALRVTQDNFIAHNNLGLHYLKLKRHEEAIQCFEAALRIRPGFAATHSNLGLSLAALGRNDEAVEKFREALRLRPNMYEAQVNLANLLVMQEQLPAALELLQRAVAVAPHYPEGQFSLANALVEESRFDEALAHLRIALELRPDYAEAVNCLGSISLRQGKYEDAILHYRTAVQMNPNLAEAHSNLGLALASVGQTTEASAAYETALRLDPELLSAHFGLAILFEAAGQLDASAQHWGAALEKSPSLAGAREQMGILLARQGKLKEAMPHLAEAIRLQPENARLRAYHGLVLDQAGQPREAREEYRKAIELGEQQPEVLNNLSWILATSSTAELRAGVEAVRLAELACRLTDFKEARFIGTLAAAYAEAGRFDEAVATARRAIAVAQAAGQLEVVARNTELAELYAAKKPFHETAHSDIGN